ncbi:hypothetical protein Q4488_10325 [Amphritea sp. 1_MG-2023]|uniref:polysaccharide biosynthesis/export family protein n=1 Tax=Amphritea sp. 1_MG-2023 TaxID=3062670 RepID=UPI0026E1389C|nr:hypothetical protein [Amphritea sp. 1_MG-2023]MDO6563777.1 hypothetical protein [Amphritea sp. 1_MG-2023]
MMKCKLSSLVLSLTLISLCSGCAKPYLSQSRDADIATRGHWFSEVLRQTNQPVKYLSPALPYLGYETAAHVMPHPQSSSMASQLSERPPLSPGDRLRLIMPNDALFNGVTNGTEQGFNGVFTLGIDGTIKLPYLPVLPAAGLSMAELESRINHALENAGMFRHGMANVSLMMLQWAPVKVYVSGAVFQPGQHTINQRKADDRAEGRLDTSGDMGADRLLTAALRAAGGVRPDADLTSIELIRGQTTYSLDISGIVLGYPVQPITLMHNDQIRINSTGSPQRELVKNSAITPPGIRVFISNLTVPAMNNASSAVGEHATSLPYGARLHNAVVSGNCAGGSASTNSDRYAVLVTQDPVSQRAMTIERDIEGLLRSPDRLDLNPYLMPNDSVVCYDSNISNLRDIGRTITDLILPFTLLF